VPVGAVCVATAIAGGIIWWTGWNRVDSIAALVVAGLMLKAGIGLVRDSGRIFLEAAPRGLDPVTIAEAIRAVPTVTRLDDLHVWEVTSGMPALSGHIYVSHEVDCHDVRRSVEAMLHDLRYHAYHFADRSRCDRSSRISELRV